MTPVSRDRERSGLRSGLPPERVSDASGLYNLSRALGGIIGIALGFGAAELLEVMERNPQSNSGICSACSRQ